MFFMARHAAATFAGRLGRTSTISTLDRSKTGRVYQPRGPPADRGVAGGSL
jgi:hypothetical protein